MKQERGRRDRPGGDQPLQGVRLACIFPPFRPLPADTGPLVLRKHSGVLPNLDLLYAAATLERAGADVLVIDAHAGELSLEQTLQRLRAFDPACLISHLSSCLFPLSRLWLEGIKAALRCPALVTGAHPGFYPAEMLIHPPIDAALNTDPELALVPLVEALLSDRPLSGVPGIAFADPEGRVSVTGEVRTSGALDTAPWPSRHLVDNARYCSSVSQHRNFTLLLTGRAPLEGGADGVLLPEKRRLRSVEAVVDELEHCQVSLGIHEVELVDPFLPDDRERLLALCGALVRRKLRIQWALHVQPEGVDRALLETLAGAGCHRVYFSIESADEGIRRRLQRSDLSSLQQVVRDTRQLGLHTYGNFTVGLPGETRDTVWKALELAQTLHLDDAHFSPIMPLHPNLLHLLYLSEAGRDFWRECVLQEGPGRHLYRQGTSLSEQDILRLAREASRRFYCRPRHLAKALLRIRSRQALSSAFRNAWFMVAGEPA